jgi:hypothetical protein
VRASGFARERRRDGVRLAVSASAIPRFAQSGHVIDIDAKFQHEIALSAKHTPVWQRNKKFLARGSRREDRSN